MKRLEETLAKEGKKANLDFLHLELNSIRKSTDAAEEFKKRETRLDILSRVSNHLRADLDRPHST